MRSSSPLLDARASYSPEVIRGINLGGWLVTEEWITPSLYNSRANDEWHLCAALGKDRCLRLLRDHWNSFITRSDIEDMKSAGLNSLRIPVGYWSVDLLDYEPYVSGQYPYLIRAVQWARELGFTVLIDLHGAPGSQNGYDHSGLIGLVEFAANSTNIDRSVNVLRNLTDEFSRPEYGGVVTGIQLLNEPRLSDTFDMTFLKNFYTRGADVVQAGSNEMNVTAHDAFWGVTYWADYSPFTNHPSSDRFTLDTHQYYSFAPLNNLPRAEILDRVCNMSRILKSNTARTGVPPTIVGEWSLETGNPPSSIVARSRRGDTQAQRTWYRTLFEAQLAAYSPNDVGQASIGWYYWTWKTEWDIDTWSYQRGLRDGYIPSDVSNSSSLVFPILGSGCIDAGYNYTAPKNPGTGGAGAVQHGNLALIWLALLLSFGIIVKL